MRLRPGTLTLLTFLLAILGPGAPPAAAAIPKTLTYQGLLLASTGAPVADRTYSLTFKLYTVASGGTALWTETQPAVSTTKGVFSVTLGSTVAINLAFDVPYYLGVTIGANPELAPRTALTSTAYANTAGDLQVPWSKFQGDGSSLAVIANTQTGGGGALSLLAYTASLSTPVLTVIDNNPLAGYGLHSVVHVSGSNPAVGLYSEVIGTGSTGTAGVVGVSPANYGMDGESVTGTGVLGRAVSGAGIVGTTGVGSPSNTAAGISGTNASTGAGGYGVYASHAGSGEALFAYSNGGSALRAYTNGTAILLQGIHAEISSPSAGAASVAVFGENLSRGGGTCVEGHHHGSGIGVYGHVDGAGFGVVGSSNGAGGIAVYGTGLNGEYAGEFDGPVTINGNLSVTGSLDKTFGSFKIDHPLDPENEYLYHSFVESPEMKNIYDGRVTTDGQGEAEVELPKYFEALNRDFRYQLTPIGQPARAWVVEQILGNRFRVRTDRPHVKLCWQVTGVRHDAVAVAHPMRVEVPKPLAERGTYIDPGAFGKPDSQGMGYANRARLQLGVNAGGK